MEYTVRELIEMGIIKSDGKNYQNAVVECHISGGIKGIWIGGNYYKAINRTFDVVFNIGNQI